jgi:hypothetical protein
MHTARDNEYFCVSLPKTIPPYDYKNEVNYGVMLIAVPQWPWRPDVKNVISRTTNNNK